MGNTSTIEKGSRVKLKVLLEPMYGLDNEMVCQYRSGENTIEFSLHPDDLMADPSGGGKMILSKALIVEDILENLFICRIEGSHRMLSIPGKDLET